MAHLVLSLINAPLLLLLLTVGIAVQTSLFNFYPLLYLQPDLVLICVVWFAFKRKFTEGGVLTFIAAYICELHSSAPKGLYLFSYMVVYLTLRALDRRVLIASLQSFIGATLFASVLWKLVNLSVLGVIGGASNQWRHTLSLLIPGAVMEGVLGVWIFKGLEKFDWVTFKDPRANQVWKEELLLEEEGI